MFLKTEFADKSTIKNLSDDHQLASVAQLDALSDWGPGGRRLNPRRVWQHSYVKIDHEVFLLSFSPFR